MSVTKTSISRVLPPALALATLAVIGAPAASTAAGAPPQSCAQKTAYGKNSKYFWVKSEVCLTHDKDGTPTIRFWTECQEYWQNGTGIWGWRYVDCDAHSPYVLTKDGKTIAKSEPRDTYWRSLTNRRDRSFRYQCQGPGVYSVTSDFTSTSDVHQSDRTVTFKFEVSAAGC
ncbi:hypothetical protein ABZ743_24260 [Streptomyces sp. NPDC006662]|uniref:hypothetical protein n=1 Tax=Streptomyces sp. NPDC006662 TaxID=3156902 RepID=UPI00340D4EFD